MKISDIKIFYLFLVGMFFLACENNSPSLQNNGLVFNIDKFEENLIDYITFYGKEPVGWAYTISANGQLQKSFADGMARTADDGELPFTLDKEINVASVTKFYTAIAAMQLLEANNISVDEKIDSWLPSSWAQGPAINNLSFGDLLSHHSGLKSENTNFSTTLTYQGLKDCIETGVVKLKSREYLNVNFALFRILIPSLWSALNANLDIDLESDANTQYWYLLYMQQYIFDEMNLANVGCVPEDRSIATLYYNVDDPVLNRKGDFYDNWNAWAGGGGYFMTVLEMAKVLAYFEHTNNLLSEQQRNIMKENRFGMEEEDASLEIHGSYFSKGGSISNSDTQSETQGVLTQMVMFPSNGIDCVVVMNSRNQTFKDDKNLRQTIYNAYNDAWE